MTVGDPRHPRLRIERRDSIASTNVGWNLIVDGIGPDCDRPDGDAEFGQKVDLDGDVDKYRVSLVVKVSLPLRSSCDLHFHDH